MSRFFNRRSERKINMELVKKVDVKDIKSYLQEEYDRALQREAYIDELEAKEKKHQELQVKYDALLVIQEKVSERLKRREEKIQQLKNQLNQEKANNVRLKSQLIDVKANAKRLIAEAKSGRASTKKKVTKND